MKGTLLAILAHPDDESFGPGGTLARYAAEGHPVHVCIATDGAAGSISSDYDADEAHRDLVATRRKELHTACDILGVTAHWLGYRDSGMSHDESNLHPSAFVQSDDEEAVGRVVRLIRTIKPEVVMTHDETGGYYHPDHIRCWAVVTAAFHKSGDATYLTEQPPHQPKRLYYTALSKRWTKLFETILRMRGQNPKRVGTNQDIDVTRLGIDSKYLHAHVDYKAYWDVKEAAVRAHASQGGQSGGPFRIIPVSFRKQFLSTDTLIRAHPPAPDRFRETSLFT